MSKVVIDEALLKTLQNLAQPVELCDSSGKVVGQFTPKLDPAEYNLEPQISEEELRRREQSNEKRYTTAEVLAYLEKL